MACASFPVGPIFSLNFSEVRIFTIFESRRVICFQTYLVDSLFTVFLVLCVWLVFRNVSIHAFRNFRAYICVCIKCIRSGAIFPRLSSINHQNATEFKLNSEWDGHKSRAWEGGRLCSSSRGEIHHRTASIQYDRGTSGWIGLAITVIALVFRPR